MKTSSRGGDERPRRGPAALAAAAGLTVALIAHGQVLRVPGRPPAPALAEPTPPQSSAGLSARLLQMIQ